MKFLCRVPSSFSWWWSVKLKAFLIVLRAVRRHVCFCNDRACIPARWRRVTPRKRVCSSLFSLKRRGFFASECEPVLSRALWVASLDRLLGVTTSVLSAGLSLLRHARTCRVVLVPSELVHVRFSFFLAVRAVSFWFLFCLYVTFSSVLRAQRCAFATCVRTCFGVFCGTARMLKYLQWNGCKLIQQLHSDSRY